MNPKPWASWNHFTLPVVRITVLSFCCCVRSPVMPCLLTVFTRANPGRRQRRRDPVASQVPCNAGFSPANLRSATGGVNCQRTLRVVYANPPDGLAEPGPEPEQKADRHRREADHETPPEAAGTQRGPEPEEEAHWQPDDPETHQVHGKRGPGISQAAEGPDGDHLDAVKHLEHPGDGKQPGRQQDDGSLV